VSRSIGPPCVDVSLLLAHANDVREFSAHPCAPARVAASEVAHVARSRENAGNALEGASSSSSSQRSRFWAIPCARRARRRPRGLVVIGKVENHRPYISVILHCCRVSAATMRFSRLQTRCSLDGSGELESQRGLNAGALAASSRLPSTLCRSRASSATRPGCSETVDPASAAGRVF
jgi:hypothetical protein